MYCHPLFLNPRSTVGALCRGFQKVLTSNGGFNSITDILHDLRCLTTVSHYSSCKGLSVPYSEMPLYKDLCHAVKRRLERFPSLEGLQTFESCRLAIMVFTELVLLNDISNTAVLAAGIKTTLEDADIEENLQHTPELMLWILFMGNIAAIETELDAWYKDSLGFALFQLNLHHFEAVRSVLIEFLWLEVSLNQRLKIIWAALKSRINPNSSVHRGLQRNSFDLSNHAI